MYNSINTTYEVPAMPRRLTQSFYRLPVLEAAPLLLGKLLCRNIGGRVTKLRITETEAYRGEEDTACHARHGRTQRTAPLYAPGGIAYVYLCYGVHSLLNVVTGEGGFPEAALIRGVEGYDGPGKLTKFLSIDRSLNGENLITSNKLWLEDDGHAPEYTAKPRIGIDYACDKYRNIEWRFVIHNS